MGENYFANEDVPIVVVDRRTVCENTKFLVHFDHVIDKAGHEVRDYLVVSPKSAGRNFVAGVAILPISNGQVGLVRIFRPAIRAYSWEIPQGFLDDGEPEEFSAMRELLEETGLAGNATCFSSMGYITPDAGVLAARVHIFLALECDATHEIQGELGLGNFKFFTFKEFEEMVKRSEIQDASTLAAWSKYQLLTRIVVPSATKSIESKFHG